MLFLPGDEVEAKRSELDWLGLLLLSPGLALVLLGLERVGQRAGLLALAFGGLALVLFVFVEQHRSARALIDLGQFRSKVFAVASIAQFLTNGVMFAGQMLIPLFLIQACGISPSTMGWMLAPLGLGMMVTFPSLGFLTDRFGSRLVAAGGGTLALCATLALAWQATHGLDPVVFVPALFLRGIGQGALGLPAISAAYASVGKNNLPMATTTLNIIQRLGGPVLTTLCAVFLGEALKGRIEVAHLNGWTLSFLLLSALHALTLIAAAGLPGKAKENLA